MKELKMLFGLFLSCLLVSSCEKDNYELGEKLDVSAINYEVIQDYDIDPGGNTVILKFNTDKAIPVWNYGTGRSNKAIDTIRYAFKGDYSIDLNAVTAGGVVDLDPVNISVTEDNFDYIDHPLWNSLTGGAGKSKTWLLDLDKEGASKFFAGPMFFYGVDNGWLEGGEAWDGGDTGCYGADCWNYSPDYPGNTWLMPAADYGSMTFSLEGRPNVQVNHMALPALGEQSGTFALDTGNHKISLIDVEMLHNSGNDSCVNNWGELTIFSLTEDTMQLGVLRRDDCEGPAMLVYNFISKEYAEANEL